MSGDSPPGGPPPPGAPPSGEPSRDDILAARAYLLRIAEPPALALHAFVARYGPVNAAERVRAGAVPEMVRRETAARRHLDLGAEDRRLAAAAGARLVVPEDAEWPQWRFHALGLAARRGAAYAGEPLALWVAGQPLTVLGDLAVAVVGARAATGYGETVAADLGHGLACRDVGVVSGAAYGIDGAAHRGALAANGRTVAVLAGGVDVPYPAGHDRLLADIREHGAVVSEYPPGCAPARHRFLVRNRLIAALAEGTVVVEAGKRSGARNTAATTSTLGRVLMAVPGPVTSALSVGCHDMLRSGDAVPVSSVEEVVESVGRLGLDLVGGGSERDPVDELDQQAKRVYEALRTHRDLQPEQLAVESGVDVAALRAVLITLELLGLANRRDTGWRKVGTRRNRGALTE